MKKICPEFQKVVVKLGLIKLVDVLLAKGANGNLLLYGAIYYDQLPVIKHLLEKGYGKSTISHIGWMSLEYCSIETKAYILKRLYGPVD